MVFPVISMDVRVGTIKKAERPRIDAFELWCWRRFLRVLWAARRSNQSVQGKSTLDTHWKDWSWSSKYFGYVMQRPDSLEKSLMLGKIEGRRRRRRQRTKWLDNIINSVDLSFSKLWDMVTDREAWCAAVHGVTKSRTQLSDWISTLICSWPGTLFFPWL